MHLYDINEIELLKEKVKRNSVLLILLTILVSSLLTILLLISTDKTVFIFFIINCVVSILFFWSIIFYWNIEILPMKRKVAFLKTLFTYEPIVNGNIELLEIGDKKCRFLAILFLI